jgi:hypothetical protein
MTVAGDFNSATLVSMIKLLGLSRKPRRDGIGPLCSFRSSVIYVPGAGVTRGHRDAALSRGYQSGATQKLFV